MKIVQKNIRNFCIISHINHGKSTLADRFLEITHSVGYNKIDRIMDSMLLEQERGITIKLNTAQMSYEYNNVQYLLNLIDTPGHIDFTYEVSRSLAACQGAILLIDASKGIQAQTITNLNLAKKQNLKIIPVINKIDLKHVEIERIIKNIEILLNIERKEITLISAKNNINVEVLLQRIIEEIDAPSGDLNAPLQALIFDAYYDRFQGVTGLIYLQNGTLNLKDEVIFMSNKNRHQITNIQIKHPELHKVKQLTTGQVGLFQGNIRSLEEIKIGDTLTNFKNPTKKPLPGYKEITPVVFANFFPGVSDKYHEFVKALAKIKLNDNSFQYIKTSNSAFGNGFHCGFLGLLHLEIIQERIRNEHNLEIIVTYPSVKYRMITSQKDIKLIDNIAQIDDWNKILKIEEPICNMQILTPITYLGKIMELINLKRGKILEEKIIDNETILLKASTPMAEIVIDFFDMLKSLTNGYASFDYQFSHYQQDKLVKLDILINHQIVPAFSQIIHETKAYERGKQMLENLKTSIPKHNFEIPIQASINQKIIARTNIKAHRKDVTAKCYGGDITRKRKLWEKQKEGKKRMRLFGKVNIPYQAFLKVLKQ